MITFHTVALNWSTATGGGEHLIGSGCSSNSSGSGSSRSSSSGGSSGGSGCWSTCPWTGVTTDPGVWPGWVEICVSGTLEKEK